MLSDATEPKGSLTIRTLAMPADTNPAGDIFGGWVMSQMDIAGAIAAVERSGGRVVTVAVEAMTFIAPVKVGDILCVYTTVERVGTTSITISMEAWARRVGWRPVAGEPRAGLTRSPVGTDGSA